MKYGWDLLSKDWTISKQRFSAILSVPSVIEEITLPLLTPLQLLQCIPSSRLFSRLLLRIGPNTQIRYIHLRDSKTSLYFCIYIHRWKDGCIIQSIDFPGRPVGPMYSILKTPTVIQLVPDPVQPDSMKLRIVVGAVQFHASAIEQFIEQARDLLFDLFQSLDYSNIN